jgi:hypothetical protein
MGYLPFMFLLIIDLGVSEQKFLMVELPAC